MPPQPRARVGDKLNSATLFTAANTSILPFCGFFSTLNYARQGVKERCLLGDKEAPICLPFLSRGPKTSTVALGAHEDPGPGTLGPLRHP
ncbi:hypothetical protein E2C01_053037 [Portunus trituberculatus]|uniref:Uncharacterized protein n=1 Tax=Portunus trituberculatus TaxID=210409 RepID=A0A5B7GG22_PORTR|nr:hypothetical protein [Portunus trituberculatus]